MEAFVLLFARLISTLRFLLTPILKSENKCRKEKGQEYAHEAVVMKLNYYWDMLI